MQHWCVRWMNKDTENEGPKINVATAYNYKRCLSHAWPLCISVTLSEIWKERETTKMVGWVAARPLISSTFRVTYFLQIRPGYSLFDAVPGLLRSHLRTLSSSLSFMRKVWEAGPDCSSPQVLSFFNDYCHTASSFAHRKRSGLLMRKNGPTS